MKKKLKIIILTVDQIYANYVIKKIISEYKGEINLILVSGKSHLNSSFIKYLRNYLNSAGWYYFFVQSIKLELYRLVSLLVGLVESLKENKFFPYKSLLKNYNIDEKQILNINDTQLLNKLKKLKPDLIVSIFFNQIIKDPLINLPKHGIINLHPAYLPDYKGVSPIFWAMVNKEKTSGITVHYIDSGIDTGGLIKRAKIAITKTDTEDSIYWKCAKVGSELLIDAINQIKTGEVKSRALKGGRYYSIPTKKAINKFRKNGRTFFNLKDYLISN